MMGMEKTKSLDEVLQQVGPFGDRRLKVVLTNGCFDLLHPGHVRYLEAARGLGDCLVVGLNTDESVRSLKGRQRPIFPEDERAEMLAALECVDFVVLFGDETAERLVSLLRPDSYVKGADYAPDSGKPLPEAEAVRAYGGRVELIPLVEHQSSSAVVQRILARYDRRRDAGYRCPRASSGRA